MILFVFCACFYILRLTSLSLWKTVLTSLSPNQGGLFRDSFWDGGVKITPPPPVINLLELCRKREIFYESTHIDLVQRIYLLLPRPPWFCWCQNIFAKHFFFYFTLQNKRIPDGNEVKSGLSCPLTWSYFDPWNTNAGRYPEQIHASRLVWAPKKMFQKTKSNFLEIHLFASKNKFHETFHIFPHISTASTAYIERRFHFNYSLNKTTKWFQRQIQNPVKHLRWSNRILNSPLGLTPKWFDKIMWSILLDITKIISIEMK